MPCSDRLSSALLGLQYVRASFIPLWTAVISTLYRHGKAKKVLKVPRGAIYGLGSISGFLQLVYKHPASLRRPELGPRKESDEFLYTKPVRRLIHQWVSIVRGMQMHPHAPHRDLFLENVSEVKRLLEIHSQIGGTSPGHKHNLEVLNKSAIVLMSATWESYVEDLAKNSFDFMITNCSTHSKIPNKVLAQAVKDIKSSKNDLDVWQIAGDGWKTVLTDYRNEVIKKHVDSLNTPRTENIDALFESILGIKSISKNWYWKGMSNSQAIQKLEDLVTIRGDIAHKVRTAKSVKKLTITGYLTFLNRISTITHNRCNDHLLEICGEKAWKSYQYRSST